jgi:hypothetical protein
MYAHFSSVFSLLYMPFSSTSSFYVISEVINFGLPF